MSGQNPILKCRHLGPCVESLVLAVAELYSKAGLLLPFCPPLGWVLRAKRGPGPRVGRTWTKVLTKVAGQGAEEEGQTDVEEQEWPQGLVVEGYGWCTLGRSSSSY